MRKIQYKKSKKVLIIIPSFMGGGAERQAVTVAILFKRRGYEVNFLCYSKGEFYKHLLKNENIFVFYKECNYLRRIIFVTKTIRKGHYKAVISFMPTPNFLNCIASILRKKWRVIISERSSRDHDLNSLRGRLFSWSYRRADAIVCNSNNARNKWISNYPNFENKLYTIYNTVTLGKIDTNYYPRKGDRLNVLIAATVYDIKNPMGLIHALILMNDVERKRFHIMWYGKNEARLGDHKEYDMVIDAVKKYDLTNVCSFVDATPDIANRMNESDCVALFSRLEGLPNAICEAMMIGKPIIMTHVSDYNALVEEEKNGYLCQWDDPNSIKSALLNMSLKNEEELLSMGRHSKEKAMKLFGQEKIIEKWIKIVEG